MSDIAYPWLSGELHFRESFVQAQYDQKDLDPDDLYSIEEQYYQSNYAGPLLDLYDDLQERISVPVPIYKDVIIQLLDKNYTPLFTDPSSIFFQTIAYWIYLKETIPNCGFFYPTVNERLNVSAFKLISEITKGITALDKKGASKDGGNAPKINKPILEAAKKYLQGNSKVLLKPNEEIAKKFCNKYIDNSPMKITLDDGTKWEVFYQAKCLFSRQGEGNRRKVNNKEKSIAYSTFWQKYISKVKKDISSP